MPEKVLVTWSGGKDSALALYKLQDKKEYDIEVLLTAITADYDRISLHGIRTTLLDRQAKSVGFPIEKIRISKNCSNEEYDLIMRRVLEKYKTKDIQAVAFGDIFLRDVREYRENNLSRIGMRGVFPLWHLDTLELAHKFIKLGFKAAITCVDSNALDKTFAGREFDERFLAELPRGIDPCGENGEFHSFVYDGPIFHKKITFKAGEIVLKEKRFYYCDLLPV